MPVIRCPKDTEGSSPHFTVWEMLKGMRHGTASVVYPECNFALPTAVRRTPAAGLNPEDA